MIASLHCIVNCPISLLQYKSQVSLECCVQCSYGMHLKCFQTISKKLVMAVDFF